MNRWQIITIIGLLTVNTACMAQQIAGATGDVCGVPKPVISDASKSKDATNQPPGTADLPTVVQLVEHALQCYQALSKAPDPSHPKGLPRISSAGMDFKTTTGKTTGISFSIFVFKVGASREKDVTDDISFTYSVPTPKPSPLHGKGFVKPAPADLYAELVKEVAAAASSAQSQSTALGMPLTKVQVQISYGIKFDGNVAASGPISLVTIGGNGDYNRNNTQTITLIFSQQSGS